MGSPPLKRHPPPPALGKEETCARHDPQLCSGPLKPYKGISPKFRIPGPESTSKHCTMLFMYRGGGGLSSRDNCMGEISPFRLETKISSRNFLRNLGHFLLFVYPAGQR